MIARGTVKRLEIMMVFAARTGHEKNGKLVLVDTPPEWRWPHVTSRDPDKLLRRGDINTT